LYSSSHDALPDFDQTAAQVVVDAALAGEVDRPCLLSVAFMDDQESAALHGEHFDDPTTTDVMSFPDGATDPDTGRMQLGDLAICVDVAERQARLRGTTIGEELLLYLLHGLLHLLGYDDVDPADQAEMWQQQRHLLALVGHDPGPMED